MDSHSDSEQMPIFEVNICSIKRFYKMSKFLHDDKNYDYAGDAWATTVLRRFLEGIKSELKLTSGCCSKCSTKLHGTMF